MFDEEGLVETLIGTVAFAGMFLLGRNAGKNELKKEISDKQKDMEIEKLKKEVEELKKRSFEIVDNNDFPLTRL